MRSRINGPQSIILLFTIHYLGTVRPLIRGFTRSDIHKGLCLQPVSNLDEIVDRIIEVVILTYDAYTMRECMLAYLVVDEVISNLFNSAF